jgi:hypothetical protein
MMPTALPISYSVAIAAPPTLIGSLRPVWLLVAWTILMFSLGALADPDAKTAVPDDPFRSLMIF